MKGTALQFQNPFYIFPYLYVLQEEEEEGGENTPRPVGSIGTSSAIAPLDMSSEGVAQSQAEVQKSLATGVLSHH